ncbi:carbohydrate ABC transporter permease [Brachyspira murdochii]|uniref:Sugar ABC transporter permease n=1 Tax=Brachyspira murdochii TaxID=84378 RepID=A0ABX5B369_9SPIR|nr:sugar ABC transporter permease [Brachyspira murdochii]PPS21721.1 sugar ABC transporter permease [Brachyspira murdochii]
MKKNKVLPYILILPAVVIMAVFVLYPIIVTFFYSLRKMKLTAPKDTAFIGFDNYIYTLKSFDFWYSLQNSIIIMIIVVIICVLLGLLFASILNFESRLKNILMAIAVIPWALPPVVNGILWKWIFYPGYGFLNKILYNLNIIDEPIQYLSNRYSLMLIIAIVVAWRNIPFCSIVLLSSMRAIPDVLYDAASIDGANKFQMFTRVTLPLLVPALGIIITFTSISAINVFDEVITISGYSNLGKTILLEDYMTTFSFLDFGRGSALTYLVMIVSGTLGILYIKSMSRKIDYL